jgi:hypothetical protein
LNSKYAHPKVQCQGDGSAGIGDGYWLEGKPIHISTSNFYFSMNQKYTAGIEYVCDCRYLIFSIYSSLRWMEKVILWV